MSGNFSIPQSLQYSDEVTLTPITVPKSITVTPFDSSTPNNVVTFTTPIRDASFVSSASTSYDNGSPVDLSPVTMVTPITPQSGASLMKDDEPVEKVTENDSIRDLIMSAIGVMKSRKARPDTKRYTIRHYTYTNVQNLN